MKGCRWLHPYLFCITICLLENLDFMEINKIKVQNVDFDIRDISATKTVELTQAEYDALVTKDPNTLYIITDATGGDLSDYYSKDEIDDLLDEVESVAAAALNDLEEKKLDASAYTPTDLTNYYTKSETSGATEISTALANKADTATTYTKTEVDTALGGKQATLVSGTNIKTINNESILGSGNITIQGGGGSSYTAGDGIDITNDVISVTGKVDTTAFSTYSAATEARLAEDEEVTAAALNDLDATTDAINDVVTAHTANTTVHINSTERTNWNGAVTALGGLKLVKLTQAQYDALATKDAMTLYIVTDS